ncbi:MAG: VOC family protein [Peptostreptococcaceae bacterium]|nr:VOC family protein [Peptostreptococcaceae bacterium]
MLHHIEIYVRDLARTRAFYDFLLPDLGYRLFQDWDQGFSYRCGETYLVFVQVREKYEKIEYNRCNVGLNHLAFWCSSREETDAWRKRLREKGAVLLYDERYPHAGGDSHYAVYFEDPDGIKLEIVAGERSR